MIAKRKFLDRLRRRKRTVLRALLPVLAAVWFSSGASLCFGMSADAGPHAAHDRGSNHAALQDGQADQPRHRHGRCPHCPPADGATSGTHLGCSTLDGFSDGGAPSKAPSAMYAVLPQALVFVSHIPDPSHVPIAPAASSHPVPLNLRHCVFLI